VEERKRLASRLRAALGLNQMTSRELASRVGTDEGTVSRWIHGKQKPGKQRLALVESVLGMSQGSLLSTLPVSPSPARRLDDVEPESSPVYAGSGLPQRHEVSHPETPNEVMIEFNRWLEPFVADGVPLQPIQIVEWMHRMWKASSPATQQFAATIPLNPADANQLLELEVEPGTGMAITTHYGRIVVVNQALVKMLDSTRHALVGRYVWDLNAPEFRGPGKQRIREQRTGAEDFVLLSDQGERIPVTITNGQRELNGVPLRIAMVRRRDGDKRVDSSSEPVHS